MTDLVNIILLALLGSVVALMVGVVVLSVKKWSKTLSRYSVPFAAGVLLTVAMLGLLPEASHLIDYTSFLVALLTFLGAYLFENLFCDLHHHDHGSGCKDHQGSAWMVMVGDMIHHLVDGVAITASYFVSPGLGLVTAVSNLLHEVPHEIGDFGILLKAGWKKKKIFGVNLISALMTVVGAVATFYLDLSGEVVGYLLAGVAGMFLYLGASDFLPHANEGLDKKKAVGVMLMGVLLMYAVLSAVPHSHENEKHEHDQQEHHQEEECSHEDHEMHEDEDCHHEEHEEHHDH